MGGKFPVDIPPISNYIPGISDQFPLSSFAVLCLRVSIINQHSLRTKETSICQIDSSKPMLFLLNDLTNEVQVVSDEI
jgi:hypothetical protein